MAVDSLTQPLNHAPISVLVIDAHPAVGLGLVRLIGVMPGVQICGLAARGPDGLECAGLVQPDVALVDAELPNDAARATIRQLRAFLPATRVVALGLYSDRRAAMLAAGAHAFLLKDAGFEALRAAIVPGFSPDLAVQFDRDSASTGTPGGVRR